MKSKIITLLVSISFSACASSKRLEQKVEQLERNDKTSNLLYQDAMHKIEELNNSIMVLQDRVETLKIALDRQKVQTGIVQGTKSKIKKTEKVVNPTPKKQVQLEPFMPEAQKTAKLPAVTLTNKDLERMEEKTAAVPPVAAVTTSEDPEATKAYNRAFEKFEKQQYPEAIRSLQDFIKKYPDHVYADNAMYWVGEAYFQKGDYSEAASRFEKVAHDFPSGNKVPDALLRAGSCHLRLSNMKHANLSFEKIVREFPRSIAARKAKILIAEISEKTSPGRM